MTQDTLDLMEEKLADSLNELSNLPLGSRERSAKLQEISVISEKLNAFLSTENDALDKKERRRLESERTESTLEIEKKKLHMPWERFVLSLVELGLPLFAVSAWIRFQADYEKDERICTSVGKYVWSLPKMFIRAKK